MLAPVLSDPAIHKVGHDIKADLIVLGRHGVVLAGLDVDTMLAAYLVDANQSNQALEPLALEQVGYKALDEEQLRGKGVKARGFAELPPDAMLDYAGERADLALQLADVLVPALEREGLDRVYRELELPLVPILAGLERTGVRVDVQALAAQATRVDRELNELGAEIYRLAGETFNINSPQAAGRRPVRQAQAAGAEADRNHAHGLHRRRSARGAGPVARAAADDPRLAQASRS